MQGADTDKLQGLLNDFRKHVQNKCNIVCKLRNPQIGEDEAEKLRWQLENLNKSIIPKLRDKINRCSGV